MAHFAQIDSENIVIQVLVVPDQHEHRGQDFLANDLGLGGTWIQTSYNNKIRKQFAGPGFTYLPEQDIFIAPQPADWFYLNSNFDWDCPEELDPFTGENLSEDEIILHRLEKLASTGLDLSEVIGAISV